MKLFGEDGQRGVPESEKTVLESTSSVSAVVEGCKIKCFTGLLNII